MCMSLVNFSLKKVNGRWIGTGYKAIRRSRKSIAEPWRKELNHKIGQWMEANQQSLKQTSDGYPRGFHIFLKKEDAIAYSKGTCGYSDHEIREVKFEHVLALGYNEINSQQGVSAVPNCVIALKMKIGPIVE